MPVTSSGIQRPGMNPLQPPSPTQPAPMKAPVTPAAPPPTVQTVDTSNVPGKLSLSLCSFGDYISNLPKTPVLCLIFYYLIKRLIFVSQLFKQEVYLFVLLMVGMSSTVKYGISIVHPLLKPCGRSIMLLTTAGHLIELHVGLVPSDGWN